VGATTALGAAYAAGLSVGMWKDFDELSSYWREQDRWTPTMDETTRDRKVRFWRKAVSRTLNWISVDPEDTEEAVRR
jgi:glycerol kinase